MINDIANSIVRDIDTSFHYPILFYLYDHLPDAKKANKTLNIRDKIEFVMNKSKYLVSLTGDKGKFLAVNKRWEELLGYTYLELTQEFYFKYIHPDDREKSGKAAEEHLTEGKVPDYYRDGKFSNRYIKKNGETVIIHWSILVDFDPKRRIFVSIAEWEPYKPQT